MNEDEIRKLVADSVAAAIADIPAAPAPDLSEYVKTDAIAVMANDYRTALASLSADVARLSDPAPADIETRRAGVWITRVLSKWFGAERPSDDEIPG